MWNPVFVIPFLSEDYWKRYVQSTAKSYGLLACQLVKNSYISGIMKTTSGNFVVARLTQKRMVINVEEL